MWLYVKVKKQNKDWEAEHNTSFFIAKVFQKSSISKICESSFSPIQKNFLSQKISEFLDQQNSFSKREKMRTLI